SPGAGHSGQPIPANTTLLTDPVPPREGSASPPTGGAAKSSQAASPDGPALDPPAVASAPRRAQQPGASPRDARQPLGPAWLHGGREFLIYVECQNDRVIVHPFQRRVAVEALSHSPRHNPLFQTIRAIIARKQATVQPGDKPYRPEIRFLVH